jgi:hypothetical protein
MLNILLYLNETLKLPIEKLFGLYTRKMIEKGYVQVI